MLRQILLELYERDLGKLREEIEAYSDEADLWKIDGDILNSTGNLCLHINGNLQHFFGAVLGGTDYVRNRDAEFADKGISREKMLADIDETRSVIKATLAKLSDEDLDKTYPIEVFRKPMTTAYFLTHLATHLNWHLGQIDYHRRLL